MKPFVIKQPTIKSTNQDLLMRRQKVLPKGLGIAFPIFAKHAKNAEIWDVEDNRYIDFIGGIGVLNTGHTHPKITQAVAKQLHQFSHTSAQIVNYESYVTLVEKLCDKAPISTETKAFLLTTGGEAIENAIKIARCKTGRAGVISFVGGFHGRTLMCMGLTGRVSPYKRNFGPLAGSIFHAPFPAPELDISEEEAIRGLKNIFKADIAPEEVAAILIEPVQGEGGFYALSPSFAKVLRDICDKYGIVLIFDEVQCGFGRTGTLFTAEQLGVEPDLITVAKCLAGGYPLSAVIGRADIMDAPEIGGLGGTYSGNPLATVAALAVMDVIEEENLLQRSFDIGEKISGFLHTLNLSLITNIRHKGAMLAFDLVDTTGNPSPQLAEELKHKAFCQGLLLATCGMYGNCIRMMMPLTIDDAVLEEGLQIIKTCLLDMNPSSAN